MSLAYMQASTKYISLNELALTPFRHQVNHYPLEDYDIPELHLMVILVGGQWSGWVIYTLL